MTLGYHILSDEHLVEVTARATASFDGFIEGMIRLANDPVFVSDYPIIADFREAHYHPSFADVRRMGTSFAPYRRTFRGRVAFVVRDRLQLKLGRFAALLAKVLDFDIAVFEQPEDADRWLNRRKDRKLTDLKKRILDILARPRLSGLATVTPEGTPWVRYVTTQADTELQIRFATVKESRKVAHIAANPKVHLLTGVEDPAAAATWLQVAGVAEISDDPKEKRDHWNDRLHAYFDGPTDSSYVVGIIRPYRIELMDMGKMKPDVWQG
jgi:general stress protein 26